MDEAERRRRNLWSQTTQDPVGDEREHLPPVPTLTILGHPDVARVGEQARLPAGSTEVSRLAPDFGSTTRFPLADPFLSRRGVIIHRGPDRVSVARPPEAAEVRLDGAPLTGAVELGAAALERGVVLNLRDRVVLLLHLAEAHHEAPPPLVGLLGVSDAMTRLRQLVLRFAAAEVPVLILGESGTGKELVAQALHANSARRAAACVCLDMGAVVPSVAASELFGHVRGAFTGAETNHDGAFLQANGGTLFLDEIAETPAEVQAMLLRALETGVIRPVGAQREQLVDVRVLAATDGDLDAMVRGGRFKAPLLHRLSGLRIAVPPLRARREDLGILLVGFLREELSAAGAGHRLEPRRQPWLNAEVVERLALYPWPGNIRELKNVARQMAYGSDETRAQLPASVQTPSGPGGPQPPPMTRGPTAGQLARAAAEARPSPATRRPDEVTDEEVRASLRAHRWHVEATARALGLSKGSLYAIIERSPTLRTAKDVPVQELLRAHDAFGGDLDRMADHLEVSKAGLRLRLRDLGA